METFKKIEKWAEDRNLIEGSSPEKQMLKLTEEVGELAGAIARDDILKIMDGIGDAVVVLTILAKQLSVTIESCIDHAYEEIKDRKGRMHHGIFIKEDE